MKKSNILKKKIVGILGYGDIGSAIGRVCKEAGFRILVRELKYDQIRGQKIDILHVNIPEKSNIEFVRIVCKNIVELKPKLTVINSSVIPGTTRKIYRLSKGGIVHSPIIGLHPNLYESIKFHFTKVIGPIDKKSANLALRHFKRLRIKTCLFDSPENSETAKLLDRVYFAWNIIFCKWAKKSCDDLSLNFDQVYTVQNSIYNEGYKKLLPNTLRPILIPMPGPITGHCTISDTQLFHKIHPPKLTKFILDTNKRYFNEVGDIKK